jgi:hypothetical protein
MIPTFVFGWPTGKETGDFLALDLGMFLLTLCMLLVATRAERFFITLCYLGPFFELYSCIKSDSFSKLQVAQISVFVW